MADGYVKWSSNVEFLVTLVGYSFGLPDVWRLPYLAYRNGGGAFLMPYVILMLLCGAPLYFIEIAMSQFSGKGPWRIWDICPLFRGFGLAVLIINGVSLVYDAAMRSWILEYLVNSFKAELPWTNCENIWNTPNCVSGFPKDYYVNSSDTTVNSTAIYNVTESTPHPVSSIEEFWMYKVLRKSSGIEDIGDISAMYVLYYAIVRLLVFLACVKSVKTLGKMMYVTALLPVILIIIIWARALTLPGAVDGMLFFITPDFSQLANIKVWIEAAFMTFYTLGPGWGGLMMMGCHNEFHTKCLRASVGTTVCTLLYGLLNGFVVFSVVGVMAAEANVPVDSAITSGGFSIGFVAYPKALSYFPVPQVWSVLFFITLLLPGIDAMTVETEPVMLILEENFPRALHNKRPLVLGVFSVVVFLLGLPFATRAGVYMFQLVDWYLATWSIMLICIGESIVFSWIYGGHRVSRDVHMMLGRPLPALFRISCAFIMPIFLLFLLMVSVYTYRPPTLGDYTYPAYATAIGWCFALSSIVPILVYAGRQLYRAEGSMRKRLRVEVTANEDWGPVSSDATGTFVRSEAQANLTLKQLFMFNLTGKGGIEHVNNASEPLTEMSSMNTGEL